MVKPNYSFAKRQRDLAKKQKKDEKKKLKAEAKQEAQNELSPELVSDNKDD